MKSLAMIHSLKDTREVEIIQYKDVNHIIAEYNGKHYTAIDNHFVGLFYVDDLYGEADLAFRF